MSFTRQTKRTTAGSSIAEFGPALFILLIVLFFPFLDLLMIFVKYGAAMQLNYLQVREAANAALVTPSSKQPDGQTQNAVITNEAAVIQDLNNIGAQWGKSGLGMFTGPNAYVQLSSGSGNLFLQPNPSNATSAPPLVMVSTQVQIQPFLAIPFFAPIPGLNAPIAFKLTDGRAAEIVKDVSD